MSLEIEIGRLIVAVETLTVTLSKKDVQQPVGGTIADATKKRAVSTAPKGAPVVQTEPEFNPFENNDAPAPAPAEITEEKMKELLTRHAAALGAKVTIAMIIKHGADAITPKINTIPKANYSACFAEATADLLKIERKK